MLPDLNKHERSMLRFIEKYRRRFSHAPSLTEIQEAVGLASKDHVFRDLNSLEEKGYIRRQRRISRSIEVLFTAEGRPYSSGSVLRVPLLGSIVAGQPLPVLDDSVRPLDMLEVTREMVPEEESIYALRVKGNSMIDALVGDGDLVVMKHQQVAENGDVVAVWLKDEGSVTLKRFYLEKEKGRVRLQPANPAMEAMYYHPSKVEIQGKVITVIRQLKGAHVPARTKPDGERRNEVTYPAGRVAPDRPSQLGLW